MAELKQDLSEKTMEKLSEQAGQDTLVYLEKDDSAVNSSQRSENLSFYFIEDSHRSKS